MANTATLAKWRGGSLKIFKYILPLKILIWLGKQSSRKNLTTSKVQNEQRKSKARQVES